MDFLNFQNNEEIKAKLGNENIKFSAKIKKKKMGLFPIFQDRNFIITNKAIYNFKKFKIKRRKRIEDLYGLTYSLKSNQFIIHFNENDYDYLLKSEKKDTIIILLENLYEQIKNQNLLFSIKDEEDLTHYVVTKKEWKYNPYSFKFDKRNIVPIKEFFQNMNSGINKGIHDNFRKNEENFNDLKSAKKSLIKEIVQKIENENNGIEVIYPEGEINDNDNLMSLIFLSSDESLKYGIICKSSDIFNGVVNKIFEREPKFRENLYFFLCNGTRVNEYRSLKDNKIKDGNVVILQQM